MRSEPEMRLGAYEGHDCCTPADDDPDVVAVIGGERIYAVDYESGPAVLFEEML